MAERQRGLAQALLDQHRAPPDGWHCRPGADVATRLAVYRNNVLHSLVAALGESFPVCREFVGDEFFDALAASFARAHPPQGPVVAEWGAALPGFIESFAPSAAVPALADLARLEWARQCAWHAADANPVDAAVLAAALAEPQALPGMRMRLHPALRALTLQSAAVSVWGAHQGLGRLDEVDPAMPEAAWVLRPDDDVLVVPVAPGLAAWALALQGGATLAEATTQAQECDATFDLTAAFALALHHGLVCALG